MDNAAKTQNLNGQYCKNVKFINKNATKHKSLNKQCYKITKFEWSILH